MGQAPGCRFFWEIHRLEVCASGGPLWLSDAQEQPLETFMNTLPVKKKPKKTSKHEINAGQPEGPKPPTPLEALLIRCPWMCAHLRDKNKKKRDTGDAGNERSGAGGARASARPKPPPEPTQEEQMDEAEVDRNRDEVRRAREDLEDQAEEIPEEKVLNFRCAVHGGLWGTRARSRAIVAIKGEWCHMHAREFCFRLDLNKTAAFSPALYGDRNAKILCTEWVSRMDFFYEKWKDSHDMAGHLDLQAEAANYVPTRDFTKLMDDSATNATTMNRGMTIATILA